MLGLIADVVCSRPRRVLALTLLAVGASLYFGAGVAGHLDPYSVADPESQSARVVDAVERASGVDPKFGVVALVDLPAAIGDDRARAEVRRVALKLGRDRSVAQVLTYYASGEPSMVAHDRRSTIVLANLRPGSDKAEEAAAKRLLRAFDDEPNVALGGYATGFAQVADTVARDLRRAELLAAPVLFLLALLVFGGFVAAALPLVVGAAATALTFAVLRLLSESVSITVFALNLVTGLALGLAIDYTLLIVSRYREEIAERGAGPAALRATLATAGRTVLISSMTVAGALAGLLVFPQKFLYSIGTGGIVVALASGLAALTLLPALLFLLGERVNALPVHRPRVIPGVGWYRVARAAMRRPVVVTLTTIALMVALGAPFLRAEFTSVDGGVLPRDQSTRVVHDRLAQEFPPYRTLPLDVLAATASASVAHAVSEQLATLPYAAAVAKPVPVGPDSMLIRVTPGDAPLSVEAQRLVKSIRALDAPAPLQVGGMTAEFADYKQSVGDRLPLALAIVIAVTLALVFVLTGSVLLPLKTVVLNMTTVCAAFGILVLVFQDGRFEWLLAYESPGALESAQPVILFALVFGLSTDYAVMLLARIAELRQSGASNDEAIARGIERTGGLITSAALMFCAAVTLFATSSIVFIKELGIGTALAVLIDATIVRAMLVPALMKLLGERNWWPAARHAGRAAEHQV